MTGQPACHRCGALLSEGKKFCGKCGAPVALVPAQVAAPLQPVSPPVATKPASVPPVVSTPPPPAATPAPVASEGWVETRLAQAMALLGELHAPRLLLPLWLMVSVLVWEAGVGAGLLLLLGQKKQHRLKPLAELLLIAGLAGLLLMGVLGLGAGGAVASLGIVGLLWWGLKIKGKQKSPAGRAVAWGFLCSVLLMGFVFALVGARQLPFYARLGHSHLGFLFSQWTPPEPPPPPPPRKPLPPVSSKWSTKPKRPQTPVQTPAAGEICAAIQSQLKTQKKNFAVLEKRCQEQTLLGKPSPLCRRKLENLDKELMATRRSCRANNCAGCE